MPKSASAATQGVLRFSQVRESGFGISPSRAMPNSRRLMLISEIGVRFAETIDPERARLPVTGDFRAPIPRQAQRALRRV